MAGHQQDLFQRMRALGEKGAKAPPRGRPAAGASTRRRGEEDPSTLETREGTVREVHHEKPGASFRIVSVTVGAQVQKWVGEMPPIAKGQKVSATGREVEHETYGKQFRVSDLTATLPSSKEGLRHFLASLGVPGLGPKTIDKIVDQFGDGTENALDQPLLLATVRGVNSDLAERTTAAWQSAKKDRAEIIEIHDCGASALLATKVHQHYKAKGRNAVEIVRTNPYRLALDVEGVGFSTADKIALTLGVGADSHDRARAGVLHVLAELTNKGHAYARRPDLTEQAMKLLGVHESRVSDAIDSLARSGHAVVEEAGDHAAVFRAQLHRAEVSVAKRLVTLMSTPQVSVDGAAPLTSLVATAVAQFEQEAGITMAPAQRQAVEMAAREKVMILTGGPGCGKTASTTALLKLFKLGGLTVKLCAPTGRAAKRMSEATGARATTIHTLLAWDPVLDEFEHNSNDPIPTDVLLVDETSMMDVPIAALLLEALPNAARVVFVGDVDQLPSVGPGAVLRDMIESGAVPTVRLTEIFRQAKGSTISVAAAAVNAGKAPVADEGPGGAFYWFRHSDQADMQRELLSLVLERIPKSFGFKPEDIQVLTPMHDGKVGTIELNARLQEALNPGEGGFRTNGVLLRENDRVIVTKNDRDLKVSNGDLGRVVRVDPDDKDATVVLDIDGEEVTFPREKTATLQLAYAMSVHKAQGGGFPCVVIALAQQHYMLLSRNLVYTAITRGKKLVVLVADPRSMRTALSVARKNDRNTRLAAKLRATVGSSG